jgi:hypothetical protein
MKLKGTTVPIIANYSYIMELVFSTMSWCFGASSIHYYTYHVRIPIDSWNGMDDHKT